VQQPGPWRLSLATADPEVDGEQYTLPPRSVVVLER
jgi:hypothetical protein